MRTGRRRAQRRCAVPQKLYWSIHGRPTGSDAHVRSTRRAAQFLPNPCYTISYVLVEPKNPADVRKIKQQVAALGYLALTEDEFMQRTSNFYIYQTGGGTNMLIMTLISFIVGLSISGQTFYTFFLENLERTLLHHWCFSRYWVFGRRVSAARE